MSKSCKGSCVYVIPPVQSSGNTYANKADSFTSVFPKGTQEGTGGTNTTRTEIEIQKHALRRIGCIGNLLSAIGADLQDCIKQRQYGKYQPICTRWGLDRFTNIWYCCDDSHIYPASIHDLLRPQLETIRKAERIDVNISPLDASDPLNIAISTQHLLALIIHEIGGIALEHLGGDVPREGCPILCHNVNCDWFCCDTILRRPVDI